MQTLADLVLAASAKPCAGGAAEQPSCLGAGGFAGWVGSWLIYDNHRPPGILKSRFGGHASNLTPLVSPHTRGPLPERSPKAVLTTVPALRLPGRAGWAGCSRPGCPRSCLGSSKIFNACSHLRASNN